MSYRAGSDIVFVWPQYDGANIEQRTIGYRWRQNQEANLKIVGGDLSGSNQMVTIIVVIINHNVWIKYTISFSVGVKDFFWGFLGLNFSTDKNFCKANY